MAVTDPPVMSIADTIARLRTFLNPAHRDYWRVEQRVNIRKTIQMYESGELDGLRHVMILEGEVLLD
ncbi:hypothetical protein VF21_07653 [Pseudogymnoascus sp. 05NY08]|nr:hypothetical protein VF21_07653 [Pseudogymnoascus sp. 05NY08]